MANARTKLPIATLVLSLIAAVVALSVYAGRLRWQNAFLHAELQRADRDVGRSGDDRTLSSDTGERTLSQWQQRAMVAELATETGPTTEVWFARAPNDREAAAYQRMLQGVFEQAGWEVRDNLTADFSLRPGVFFLMADDTPPSYVLTALAAFDAAGIEVSSGRGYRAFHERKKREDANWRGFDLDADQAYVIAVGPSPTG